jgi:hypothetical protein
MSGPLSENVVRKSKKGSSRRAAESAEEKKRKNYGNLLFLLCGLCDSA